MPYILSLLIGLLLGIIISIIIRKRPKLPKNIGVLNVVESDDGPPYLFVELEEDAKHLYNEKIVSMSVKAVYANSQK